MQKVSTFFGLMMELMDENHSPLVLLVHEGVAPPGSCIDVHTAQRRLQQPHMLQCSTCMLTLHARCLRGGVARTQAWPIHNTSM
jgi:hypothetical protein